MRGFIALLIVAVAALCSGQSTTKAPVDYCSIECDGKQHTMCKFPTSTPAEECSAMEIISRKLTLDEKMEIVITHNELRQKIFSGFEHRGNPGPQPDGVNMKLIRWDNELATIAERWARQCDYGHDECRNTERGPVGQNIARKSFTGPTNFTMTSFIQDWYDEVALFNASEVSKYRFDPETGHYTQIAWANTNRIGCGAVRYLRPPRWNTTYLVCNYSPAGNVIGQPIYQIPT